MPNKLYVPNEQRYLMPLVKYAPSVIENKALRYTFEMPNRAEVVVDVNPDNTFSFRVRPEKEPRYMRLYTDNKSCVADNLSHEDVMRLLTIFYKKAKTLKPEVPNVFAIEGEYRHLKTFMTEQPWVVKGVGKEYSFTYPNGYELRIVHKIDNTYTLSVVSDNLTGLVPIYTIAPSVNTFDTVLCNLTNDEVVVIMDEIFRASSVEKNTIIDQHLNDYLAYFDAEWDNDNWVMPDFSRYLTDIMDSNLKEMVGHANKHVTPTIPSLSWG